MAKKRTGIETEVEPNPSPKKIKKDLDVKKEARKKKYEEYLEQKKKDAEEKLKSRPPWRPAGRATATRINEKKTTSAARNTTASRPPTASTQVRPVTRSMRKTQSDSNIRTPASLFDLDTERESRLKNRKSAEQKPQCPVIPEPVISEPVIPQPSKQSLPRPICTESTIAESCSETEPIKPKPTGFTPMMNRVR